jgi:beta-glucosidase
LERGIQPFAELYHWDLPQGLEARGGWRSRETIDHHLRYARVVWDALGDRVPTWTTHNEPWITGVLGDLLGIHAPGITDDWRGALTAMHHVLLSHGQSMQLWRQRGSATATSRRSRRPRTSWA